VKIHCSYGELVKVKDLKFHPENTNEHPEDQIERLAKIIKHQGWRRPITVSNQSGYVTVGEGRVRAAIFNKWKEVPVDFQDYKTEEDEFADIQADNLIATWAGTNFSKLNERMVDFGPDLDLELLGLRNWNVDPWGEEEENQDVTDEAGEPAKAIIKIFCSKKAKNKLVDFLQEALDNSKHKGINVL